MRVQATDRYAYAVMYLKRPSSFIKLEEANIPGLRVYPGSHVVGTRDAVSAAKILLGARPLESKLEGPVYPTSKMQSLRDYQRQGVDFLTATLHTYRGALLADEMGLGKTLQAITTMRLMNEGRVLVVAPRSAAETWNEELQKWAPATPTFIARPSLSEKQWQKSGDATVVISSYDHRILDRCIERAFTDELPFFLIIDEAHRIRGRKSLRSKKLEEIAPLATFRLALTATPQYDRPRDLWRVLSMILGSRFGNKPYDFDKRYCNAKPNAHGGMDNQGVSNADELKHRLSFYMLRREKKDVAKELPDITRVIRWVDPTPDAIRGLQAAQMGLSATSLHRALVATLKGKMDEAMELAQEAKRFLLFTWLKEHAHQMGRVLATKMGTPNIVITGEMDAKKRFEAVKRAQSFGWGVVATIDSASESLNMQHVASVGIMHSVPWIARQAAQAEGRLHRLGQTLPVVWNWVVMRDSADAIVMKTVISKLEQGRVTIGEKGNQKLKAALDDALTGPEAIAAEKEALAAIYKEMHE